MNHSLQNQPLLRQNAYPFSLLFEHQETLLAHPIHPKHEQ